MRVGRDNISIPSYLDLERLSRRAPRCTGTVYWTLAATGLGLNFAILDMNLYHRNVGKGFLRFPWAPT